MLAKAQVKDCKPENALDIQFLQIILHKLHGTKGKLQKPLNEIFWFCYDKDEVSAPKDEDLKRAREYDPDARFPRTAHKVARMLDDLNKLLDNVADHYADLIFGYEGELELRFNVD